MPRPYRLQAENCLYHITSRGNNRQVIFSDESDYIKFLEYVIKARDKYYFYLYTYVLMTNHYHLLIETCQPNLSKIMQYINACYTGYYNKKNRHLGHLFQGRYKSIIVDKDNYLLELSRYIHLNPVRAGMVKSPEEYRWSSYSSYIRKNNDGIINKNELKKYIQTSAKNYRELVLSMIGKTQETPLKHLYGGFILGKTNFIKEKLNELKKQVEIDMYSSNKLRGYSMEIDEIIRIICERYYVTMEDILNKRNRLLKERKLSIYLIKRLTSLSNREVGEYFNITYSGVSKISSEFDKLVFQNRRLKKEVEDLISNFKI